MQHSLTFILVILHMSLLTISNVLVQYPFSFFAIHSTYGAFSYPFIFLLTDLTVKLRGTIAARRVIYWAMLPALPLSYFLSVTELFIFDSVALRVAVASFVAYVVGQLLDVAVFQQLKKHLHWWLAPTCSTLLGNCVDTSVFFFIAFYCSEDKFMATYWPEIAAVDLAIKVIFSMLFIIPAYGALLQFFIKRN